MDIIAPEVLISEDEISLRIQNLANSISKDFHGQEIVAICVLKGAFIFCSDLIRKIELPVQLEFLSASSYGDSMSSSGNVSLSYDLQTSIKGKHVLLIEDIVDTGLTIKSIKEYLKVREPKSISLASLLYKPSRTKYQTTIDYLGFEIPDKFVVGFGLDYAGRYRELPYIGVLSAGN